MDPSPSLISMVLIGTVTPWYITMGLKRLICGNAVWIPQSVLVRCFHMTCYPFCRSFLHISCHERSCKFYRDVLFFTVIYSWFSLLLIRWRCFVQNHCPYKNTCSFYLWLGWLVACEVDSDCSLHLNCAKYNYLCMAPESSGNLLLGRYSKSSYEL